MTNPDAPGLSPAVRWYPGSVPSRRCAGVSSRSAASLSVRGPVLAVRPVFLGSRQGVCSRCRPDEPASTAASAALHGGAGP